METPHLIWSLLPLIVFLLVTKFSCIQTTNVTESGSGDDDNQPTGGGEWESDVDFYEFMNDYFALATTIVVIFGCCCGNTFTFLTVTKMNKLKSFETSSVSVYLGALAVADFSSAFWDGFINITLPNYFDFKISVQNEFLCKVSRWHDWASTRTAVFILVSFTIDRCLAVMTPVQYRNKFGSKSFAIKVVCGCAIAAYSVAIPRLIFSGLVSETKCSYMSEYKDTVWLEDIYGQWFGYYLSLAFLPSAIIVVCNVIVIYQIKKREGKQQSSNSKGRTVVQMLVSASVLFIIFHSWRLNR
ncbi:putative G-protein coupled receptor 139 [Convolutriloba macropyga]|uniref:putative G-protein coupled receptor 139 n=1 Tax=Convolutriloba macropyga TaxID=536237 RepID=UPI003F51CDCC